MRFASLARRTLLGFAIAATTLAATPAMAANPAETFVADNIHRGLDILNNHGLSGEQRRGQFEGFLLGLTDMHRIALFTLGQYRRTAPHEDQEAFAAAFQNYAVAVYQSYFSRYAGQTLKVTGSTQRTATDYVVTTEMIDPRDSGNGQPLEVDFRVLTDSGKPLVVDVAVGGIWLSLEERDQFTAFLGQNNGNIHLLINHLSELAKQFKS